MSYLPSLPPLRHFSFLIVVCVLGMGMGFGLHPVLAQSSITGEEVECNNGSAGPYPCKNVDLLSFLSTADLGSAGGEINDVWGWTDPETGTEYALVGRTVGTAFIDVSTPTEPVLVGNLPSHSGSSSWRDVKVHKNHAFIVSEASGHGMQVFDLTQLRDVQPSERPVTFLETAHYEGVGAAHNVVVNSKSGFAYIVGGNGSGTTCSGGLHMVDIQTPTTPTFAGCFADPSTGGSGTGYTHDAQCVNYAGLDPDYQGRELCFNANETALNIADVTDKNDPTTIANATYPQIGYVHQAWLTENHQHLYVDDELDEAQGFVNRTRTLVFDVTDLDSPELVKSFSGPTGAIDHNQYIDGPHAYQANYQSGLRILDVADPDNPEEVAYFDTYPTGNEASFDGAWSTYPFFERNVVLISSIGEGLFVVQPHPSPILLLSSSQREQGALLRWSISAVTQTDRIEVEHKPPEAQAWRLAGTVDGRSGPGIQDYELSFNDLRPGTHQFRVRHVSTDGTESTSAADSVRVLPTNAYLAEGPAPNPVQTRATFTITLRETQPLRVALYDALGRRVRVLHASPLESGVIHRFHVQASQRASGTYFLWVNGPSVHLTRTVVVAR